MKPHKSIINIHRTHGKPLQTIKGSENHTHIGAQTNAQHETSHKRERSAPDLASPSEAILSLSKLELK